MLPQDIWMLQHFDTCIGDAFQSAHSRLPSPNYTNDSEP